MKKLNYFRLGAFVILLGIIIVIIFKLISNYNYKKTYEYKLLQIGYTDKEVEILENNLKEKELDEILKLKKDSNLISLVQEKYFIFERLNDYLDHIKDNKKTDINKVVAIVNTDSYIDWIEETRQTNIDKKELMLVNRLYGLPKDYIPEDLIDVPLQYAVSGQKISGSILGSIIELINAGKDEGFNFLVNGSYRSYDSQESLYNKYKNIYGTIDADKIVAKPGHSEYQTGLAFELVPYGKKFDNAYESQEYLWLKENAHKYGFILRLEQGKEYITGFSASIWKLRYVGIEPANIIYNENITFEEYYAFFSKLKGSGGNG